MLGPLLEKMINIYLIHIEVIDFILPKLINLLN